jgi:hypothetical protein
VVFQDVMPTGFYRKVTLGPDGAEYVTMAVIRYSPSWLLLIILLFIQRRKIGSVFRQPAALFLVFVTVATLIFFMQVYPLTGYYYRFLMNATASLTFFVSLWIVQLIGQSRKTYALAGTLLVLPLVFAQIPLAEIFTRLNLYQRTVEANQQQPYIQFATFLRERLPQHKDMTMVFGDAGIFPYAFQSRFIDANGLSEPDIAHLFRLPDGAEKTRLYNEYILSWNPDIIILGVGPVEEGLWKAPVNRHSPFRQPQPPESFAGFRDYGIRYVCSVKAGYDIHLGVWQDSPYFDAIVTTLLEYCETEGYLLPDGFTVETQGQQIKFPGL